MNRSAEEVVVFGDRFARVNTDAHPQAFARFGVIGVEALLNVGGGANRVRYFVERGQDCRRRCA